jgi:hypothetical protein
MVSVARNRRVLQLLNKRCLLDGSILKKVVQFRKTDVVTALEKDGKKIAEVIPRLNV